MASFCKCQIHRSRVQHGIILYNVRYTWTRDLCIWHCTEWRHVGLVICASDIVQNDAMLDSWSVYLTLYKMMPCCTRDLCIWHLQNDAMLDSWSVYLTLYRMTPCWTCDLCIWHYKEWIHVGLVICVSDIIQNDEDHESNIILYNARYIDHESNMDPFCIMSDTQITTPTCRHSV